MAVFHAHYARTLVLVAALFGVFFPSSLGGTIMPILDKVAIALNCAWFGALAFRRRGGGDATQIVAALAMVGWLMLLTILFPTARWSFGTAFMFFGLALMVCTRLRDIEPARLETGTLVAINLFAIIVGAALALDIQVADQFIKLFYSAFYDDLIVSMLDWYNKPVLTFGTHSTAGLFFYLFIYLNIRTFEARHQLRWLGPAVALLLVGLRLRSTTSWFLMSIAAVQIVAALWRRYPQRMATWGYTAVPLLLLGITLWAWDEIAHVPGAILGIVIGHETAGLAARYSDTGMLGGNLRYLSENPFGPIGFTYGDADLFYGDSGLVLMMLRGSVPLVVIAYLSFCRWLALNLRDSRDVVVLATIILAFEIGYTPLLLFRLTSFLPFMIVYLNGLSAFSWSPSTALATPETSGPATSDIDGFAVPQDALARRT